VGSPDGPDAEKGARGPPLHRGGGVMDALRLTDLRRLRGLSQSELATLIGVDRTTIQRLEHGRCLPSRSTALALERTLGATVRSGPTPSHYRWTDVEIGDALQAWAAREGSPPSVLAWELARQRPSASQIKVRFGSWNAALGAASLPTRPRGGQPRGGKRDSRTPGRNRQTVSGRGNTGPGSTQHYEAGTGRRLG
jgi:DNA-binding XRE family transcriptional regulator